MGQPGGLQISNTREQPITWLRRRSNLDRLYALQLQYGIDVGLNDASNSMLAIRFRFYLENFSSFIGSV